MNKFKHLLVSGMLALIACNAQALPIAGTMGMGGSFYAFDSDGNQTSNAGNATSIDFDFFGFDMFVVNTADGDFSGLAGQYGDIQDFQFDPYVAPIEDFWSVGTFSFELTDVSRGFTADPENFLVLNGIGIISSSIVGLDNTAATWSFAGDTTGTGVFSWSATSASVPEPNILFLLSIGLIGIGMRKSLKKI